MIKYLRNLKVVLLLLLLLSTSCDKSEDPVKPDAPSEELAVHDNVRIIDSTQFKLNSDPILLNSGTYRFTSSGSPLSVEVGAVIVGDQGLGFMRRVTAITTQGNETILQTEQASLDDVFSSGTLTLESSSDNMIEGRIADAGFSHTINDYTIYKDGGLSLSLKSGTISMDPNWKIEAGFGPDGTVKAEVATHDASLHGNFVFNVTATQAVTLAERSSVLKSYYKDFYIKMIVPVFGVPTPVSIPVRMTIDLELYYSAMVNAAISREATFDSKTVFSVGASYANSQWQGMYSLRPTNTFTLGARNGKANATVNMALIPKISFRILGAVGPYASVGLLEELQVAVASPALDWNLQADAWLQTTIGVTGKVFGKSLPDFSTSWETEKLTYKSPASMERVAGDNQTGATNKALTTPIKVRVLDSSGKPESGVPVYFTPTAGNGSAAPVSILTDAEGYAQTIWTLGTSTQLQHLKVTAKNAAGEAIENAPLDFAATAAIVPHSVSVHDGNNQLGEIQKKLSKPLQVVVKDAAGAVLEGVEVEWKVKTGGGTLTAAKSKTNAAGIAQVEWTLGTESSQEVEAIVKKSDGTLVNGAPVLFKASTGSILGKWKLVKSYFSDHDTPGEWTDGYPDDHFTFNSDGTLLTVEEGDDDQMKYTFDKAKMELTTIETYTEETVVRVYQVKTLTATDFVIRHTSDIVIEYVLKR